MRALVSLLESAVQDVRYGARLLRRSPWFTCVGVASLAVGLGSGVALFTVMNAMLFRPLPGRDTGNIHVIYTSNSTGGRYGSSSFADFQSFASSDPQLFANACATTNVTGNLAVGAAVRPLAGAVVSGGYFDTFKVRPHLGRLLNRSDDSPSGSASAVVISYALWQRAFAADPAVVGRGTLLNGATVVIVGVAEPGFAGVSFDSGAEFWVAPPMAPMLLSPRTLSARGERRFRVYVRLADGVTAAHAASRLSAVAAQLRAEDPRAWTETSGSTRTVTVVRELQWRFAGGAGGAAEAIATGALGAIAAIAALACVNLATMFMARGAARTHELNVRLALGASRGRLLRQLATESLLMSVAGVAAGVGTIAAALRILDAYRPAVLPAFDVAMDWRVAGFSIVVAVAAPVLFGMAPGAHALRLAIAEGLKGRPLVFRRGFFRVGSRELLIVVQVSVSFALLIMAALFTRSLMSAGDGPHAARARQVAVAEIDVNNAATTAAERRLVTDRLLQAADRVPDVEGATAAALVPMTGSFMGISGRADDGTPVVFDGNIVAPGYFELAAIALRAGRFFDAGDRERGRPVAVVSESLARRLWNTGAVVGRAIRVDAGPVEVVGVVADVPYRSESGAFQPVLYLPLAQAPRNRFVLHARVKNEGEAVAALDRALRSVDPRIIVGAAMPLSQLLEQVRAGGKIAQWLGAVAGLLQLGLVLMATWGLVAYAIQRRTAEIAIRRALGATEASILQLVMRPSMSLMAIGIPIGCVGGVAGAKVLHSNFLGLGPIDPAVIIPAVAVLVPVVVAAAWLPARRAASMAPIEALRHD